MVYLLRKYAASKHWMQRTKFSSEFFTDLKLFFQLGTGVRYIINADAVAPTKVIDVLWLTKTSTELLEKWCGNIDVACNAEISYINFDDTYIVIYFVNNTPYIGNQY